MAGGLSSLVGGLIGVDNPSTGPYDAAAEEAKRQRQQYGAREAGNYAQEQDLSGYLRGTIAGTNGPSVAQTQLRHGLDQSNADSMAAGAGATGINSVLARYQARQAQGDQGAQLQQQAAMLRAQEVAQAVQQQAQLRTAMGAQSAGLYGQNLNAAMNYDQMIAQIQQQNAQRDTILGAAGLSGLSSLGGAYFSGKGGQGGQ